ncbi:MAG: hypothetical protein P0Y56_07005 [Candidatus Andeanibacterium colombiense]|uniref:Uncharacterized protein n=1 Tax=Candidatus Andeanibacterium colombiense TaxID=3121345 RepID=A0AAJ5XB53_9SPHN|nr:MAG: hypothetical protein P0Y56_07005 [Sphingomonadaceae bacterium]
MSVTNPLGGSRLRKIGWAAVLVTCTALYLMLHLKVNAVRGEVRQAERSIVALQGQKTMLETEFETRSNQQQLATWNEVDFGYKAPNASQYLEGERQLAQFGTPRAKGAPEPIMVANAPRGEGGGSSFSPIAGEAIAAELPRRNPPKPVTKPDLSERLLRPAERVALGAVKAAAVKVGTR